jgi:hypothetical protein
MREVDLAQRLAIARVAGVRALLMPAGHGFTMANNA